MKLICKRSSRFSRLVSCFLLTYSGVFAQGNASSIFGVVTDKNGRALLLANITAIHTLFGTSYATNTREDGQFFLDALRPGGPYNVKASYVGYRKQEREGIYLEVEQNFKIDFSLDEETIQGKTPKLVRKRNFSPRKHK